MRSLRHVQPATCLVMLSVVTALASMGASRAAPKVLTRTAQIRALSPEEAATEIPVRLRAVVTHYDPGWNDVFVQDATGGAYVAADGLLDLRQGQLVEVMGVSGAGEFAPVVQKPRIRVLGSGTLPQPRRVSYEDLISGTFDSSWVEVQGTIRSTVTDNHRLNLYVGVGSARIRATVVNFPRTSLDRRSMRA